MTTARQLSEDKGLQTILSILLKIGDRQTTKVWAYEVAKLTRSPKMPDMERLNHENGNKTENV